MLRNTEGQGAAPGLEHDIASNRLPQAGARAIALVSAAETTELVVSAFGFGGAEDLEARKLLGKMAENTENFEEFFAADARLADLRRKAQAKAGNGSTATTTEMVVDPGPRFYLETAADFLSGEDEPERIIVNEIIVGGRTILVHGEPRTRKSWFRDEVAVAAVTGRPAFGLERLFVPAPVPVLVSSQEDGRRDERVRMRRLLAGAAPPDNLFLSVHAGIDLEDEEWQETLVRDISARGIQLVIFDPIRRFSPNVDKGPAEVRAVTGFLRELAVKTGAAVMVIHHDVKPGVEADNRRRGHKASGGDWFAASDCPIHLENAGPNRTLVVPEDFKHGADPASFAFRIEEDESKTWARLTAEDVAAEDVGSVALHERILEFLRDNPSSPGNAVARGVRGSKAAILDGLRALDDAGKVDSIDEKRGRKWFVRGQE